MQNSNLSEHFELKDPSKTPDSRDPNEVSQTRVESTGVESILGDTAKTPVSELTPIVCIQLAVILQFTVVYEGSVFVLWCPVHSTMRKQLQSSHSRICSRNSIISCVEKIYSKKYLKFGRIDLAQAFLHLQPHHLAIPPLREAVALK